MVESVEELHGFAEHVAAVSVPASHEDVPDTVYPESHVGWHIDPLASESVQLPTPPFVGGVDASQGSAEHVAAVSVPALHEDVPDTVYPELHVGWHVDPLASESVQSPAVPFVGGVDASHTRIHALGGPSVDDSAPSDRAYDFNHAVASRNIFSVKITELVSHPEMLALNADA